MTRKPVYTEYQLVMLLQSNDRYAFEYLYDHYSPALYGIILRIVKDEEKAADVLQDSFLKIWKNISRFESQKGTLFTWLLNVARNAAIDKLRADVKSEKVIKLESATEHELSSAAYFPIPATLDIRSIVATLIPERKEMIELVYFQGYTHEEVSERLSMPLGTVKSRIRKGLQELRYIFEIKNPELSVA
ncbi:RNA polymerase sigma factor [Dyadobacter sandarakinus]|uniref:Sigma-70 family RNA polymerase sigma factor n=1 Tax=Dyadobacter sandarakinus TaxID=2747268 RepID=A0ABX7I8S5_9BACT|nr:sigma-70 family RNA polymerase sigma factor [Dyadobacter sandarakinus]QRR01872.1 sigma-70 family RNA polymerase sigma factor [Dyadobacter sandarakinus]